VRQSQGRPQEEDREVPGCPQGQEAQGRSIGTPSPSHVGPVCPKGRR
jgi:hypothetical protein